MNLKPVALVASVVLVLSGCATSDTNDRELVNEGFSLIVDQRWNEAEPYLLEALEENPDNPYTLLNLGVVYQQTGRYAEARDMYNRVIEMNPSTVVVRTNVSEAQGRTLTQVAERNLDRMSETEALGY